MAMPDPSQDEWMFRAGTFIDSLQAEEREAFIKALQEQKDTAYWIFRKLFEG